MGSTNSKSDSGNVVKNVYSTILQGTEEKNSTPIYRSIHNKQGLQSFIEFEEDGTVVRTLWESWKRGVKISKRRPCMGFKKPGNPFMWMCYDECHTRVLRFGSGLTRLLSNEIRYVGVCMRNRMEWSICEHACSGYNIVLVPLFPDISNENLFHILNETKLSTVVCEHDGLFFRRDSLKEIREKCPHLKNLIVANTNNRSMKMVRDTTVLSFESVEEIGMESLVVPTPPKPDDVATLCYTSGTTGLPKGAILSHQNIISACAGILQSQVEFCLSKRDVHLSYLPLSHIFERLVETAMWCHGGSVGYFSGGNNKALPAILKALRPTIFPSVPRLFYKLHDKITSKVEGSGMFKRWMFSTAFESKEYNLRNNATFENNFWDAVVFKKVKAQIGLDRVRYLITGSAPISDHVVQFLRVVFGVPILEGYGQTEGAAGATCMLSLCVFLSLFHRHSHSQQQQQHRYAEYRYKSRACWWTSSML
jgi:long-chain acyl-CoA synthetase